MLNLKKDFSAQGWNETNFDIQVIDKSVKLMTLLMHWRRLVENIDQLHIGRDFLEDSEGE